MAKTGLTFTIRESGVKETLAAFRGLPKEANKALRQRSKELVAALVPKVQSAAMAAPTPQAALVAPTVRPASDRVPAIQAGGRSATAVVFGSEFGMNRHSGWYAAPRYESSTGLQYHHEHTGREGLWFFPTVEREGPALIRAWQRAADDVVREFTAGDTGGV